MKKLTLILIATFAAVPAFAQEAMTSAGDGGWKAIAAAITISIAALGGILAQGRAVATAVDGIARNPSASDKVFTPMIIGLALIESLVIFSLIISMKLAGIF